MSLLKFIDQTNMKSSCIEFVIECTTKAKIESSISEVDTSVALHGHNLIICFKRLWITNTVIKFFWFSFVVYFITK